MEIKESDSNDLEYKKEWLRQTYGGDQLHDAQEGGEAGDVGGLHDDGSLGAVDRRAAVDAEATEEEADGLEVVAELGGALADDARRAVVPRCTGVVSGWCASRAGDLQPRRRHAKRHDEGDAREHQGARRCGD